MQYKAPTDFRATRVGSDYVLSADGFKFASLVRVEVGVYQFSTTDEFLLQEIGDVTRPWLIRRDLLPGALADIKRAYLAVDKYCFEEVENDRLTELRVEQSLEHFAPHAADTDYEDRMGWS